MIDLLCILEKPYCHKLLFSVEDIVASTPFDFPFVKLELQNGELNGFSADDQEWISRADFIEWIHSLKGRSEQAWTAISDAWKIERNGFTGEHHAPPPSSL